MTALPFFLTTSWDDGHPLDLRVADLLERHGLRGTFYVLPASPRGVLSAGELRRLSERFELGAHTMDHTNLAAASDAEVRRQLTESKRWVEQLTGRPCRVFCFPGGKFVHRQLRLVREAGYMAARSVELLSTGLPRADLGVFVLPTTVQAYPQPWWSYGKNIVKRLALRGAWNALQFARSRDWVSTVKALFNLTMREGGVFHLWGHSWEIEQTGQWQQLEDVLAFLAEFKASARILTNSEVCDHVS